MAGEMNFGLLNTNAPAEAALAPVKGMGAVNALISQDLQNQASQFEMQNALAEQQAYKQAGGDVAAAQKNLMGAGLGKQSIALGQAQAKTNLDQMKALSERLPMQREMAKSMALDPSPRNIMTNLDYQVKMGWVTPQQAQSTLQNLQGKSPEELTAYFTNSATKAEDFAKYLEDVRSNKVREGQAQQQIGISAGHLNLARERLSQEMAGGTLTPDTIDMAANMYLKTGQMPALGMGKQAAAARQAILNRATVLGTTPGADGQPAPSAADVANTVKDAKQLIAGERSFVNKNGNVVRSQNVLVDHLDTLGSAADALKNNDIRAFNAMGNKFAKATGETAPTDFDGVKKIVGDELVKAIQGGAGAVFDRKEIQESLSSANSPAQLASVVNRYKQLAKGQLQGLEKQYESQSGKKDFKERFLTEAAKKQLSAAPNAIYAVNPTTKQRIMSTDGGNTWTEAK